MLYNKDKEEIMALINTTTKKDFEDKVLHNNKVVLVDFWADWCAPCHAMTPVLKSIADKHGDDIDIVKVNIEESDENRQLAGAHQVQSIPNMVIFKDGQEIDRVIGVIRGSELAKKLGTHAHFDISE